MAQPAIRIFGHLLNKDHYDKYLEMVGRLKEVGYPVNNDIKAQMLSSSVGSPQPKQKVEVPRDIREAIANEVVEEMITQRAYRQFTGTVKIDDWKITKEKLDNHSNDFVAWIDSINLGFNRMIYYKPFDLYCQQADEWLKDKNDFENFDDDYSKITYIENEILRCRQNGLYWLDKYWHYQDSSADGGFARFKAHKAQKVIAFLRDSGYNILLGKGRQIWFTTTCFGLSARDIMLNQSFYVKIITADIEKAKQTFAQKFTAAMYATVPWMRTEERTFEGQLYCQLYKNKKEKEGAFSQVTIDNPSDTAINSGNPDVTYVDEAGLIECLFAMIRNWLPTSVQFNPNSGKMEQKGQCIAWGTSDVNNNPEFEGIFRDVIEKWHNKQWRFNFIPLFFSWHARPGMTQELYDELKKEAYNTKGPNRQRAITEFHQAFPDCIDDMFLPNENTLIPVTEIAAAMQRINSADVNNRCKYGYLEPIFDMSHPVMGDYSGDVPFKVIGAKFVATTGEDDSRTTVCIYRDPMKGWANRYYKGSDPIQNSSGKSNFGAAVFDAVDKTLSAGMYYRDEKHRYCFLQSYLLQLYYGNCYDVVENNDGQNYIDFIIKMGNGKRLVMNAALPAGLRTPSGNLWGINKKGNTGKHIINTLMRMLDEFKNNLWVHRLFLELKTFVRKTTAEGEKYTIKDSRYNFDDFIDASAYAYICYLCFDHRKPIDDTDKIFRNREKKLEYQYNDNWELVMVEVENVVKMYPDRKVAA